MAAQDSAPKREQRWPASDERLFVSRRELAALVTETSHEHGAPEETAESVGYDVGAALALANLQQVLRWPEEPKLPGPPEPEPLPIDAIPPGIRGYVGSIAASLQVPQDLPIMLALAAVSAAIGGKAVVRVRSGWQEPVNIYTCPILPPAARKSPTFAAITEPIRLWEAEDMRRAAPQYLSALDALEVEEKKLDRLKGELARGKGDTTPDMVESQRYAVEAARAAVPPNGRLLVGDATAEALTMRLAEQGGRAAVLDAEPGPLQVLAGRYSEGHARLNELKLAWSAEPILVDRVGRPPIRIERPALTLGLCMQPAALTNLQNKGAFRGEGVLGRILWVQPPHGLGTRLTGTAVPQVDEQARERYSAALSTLLEVDAPDEPYVLQLDGAALEALYGFEAEVEAELADGGRFESCRDWAGKAVGQSVRLAALLELSARAADGLPLFDGPISAKAMDAAVQLVRALASHALRVLGDMGLDSFTADMNYMLTRLQHLPAGSTESDLRAATRGRASLDGAEAVAELVDELERRGCVRRVPQAHVGPGRPPSDILEIHPAIREPDTRNTENDDLRDFRYAVGEVKDAFRKEIQNV